MTVIAPAQTPIPPPPRTNDLREMHRWFINVFRALGRNAIAWDSINFTGSDLSDIETKSRNDLDFSRKTKAVDYDIERIDVTIFGEATGGMIIQTLPTAVGADESHEVKKIDSSLNVVRVAAQPGELIAGEAFFDLELQGESIEVSSDQTGWYA